MAVCLLTASSLFLSVFSSRTIEFTNNCDETIWVGLISGGWNDNFPTWWNDDASLTSGESQTLTFPKDTISALSIWGRTKCEFSHPEGEGFICCALGDCECRQICQNETQTSGGGIKYAGTQAEITLLDNGADSYDVSNIIGFHLPMTLKPKEDSGNSGGCETAGEIFESIPDWGAQLLGACESYNGGYNLVYQVPQYDKDSNEYICSMEGTELYYPTYCLKNFSDTNSNTDGLSFNKFESFCLSDDTIAEQGTDHSRTRPSNWPPFETCQSLLGGGYACPGCGSITSEPNTCCSNNNCNCPSNYHCQSDGTTDQFCSDFSCTEPYSGESPYIDWPLHMFTAGLEGTQYLTTYDDAIALYGCNTFSGSKGYEIVFCPATTVPPMVRPTTIPPTNAPTTITSTNAPTSGVSIPLPTNNIYFVLAIYIWYMF